MKYSVPSPVWNIPWMHLYCNNIHWQQDNTIFAFWILIGQFKFQVKRPCTSSNHCLIYMYALVSGKSVIKTAWSEVFFTKFTDQLNIPFPVSLFFRRSSLSFFLFSSSAASSASLSARRASRSFLRASLLLAASSYKKVLNMNYFWMSLPRKWKVVWGWIGIDSGHMPRENYVTKLHTLHVCPHKLANWVSVRWL